MSIRLLAKTLLLIALFSTTGYGQTVSVLVETKQVPPGTTDYLRVLCNTNVPLSGLVIPLTIGANNEITIDSVSFRYTIATGNFLLNAQISGIVREGFISVIPNLPAPTFPAPGGEICRIYFRTTKFAVDAFVPVDTFYSPFEYKVLNASDAFGTTIYPSFTPGGIWIMQQPTSVDDANAEIPKQFSLEQNFPNPFNPATRIAFSLSRPDHIRLDIYNIAGHCVTTLADGKYPAGECSVTWNAHSKPSGIYLYRLTTTSGVLTRKMLLLK